MGPEQISDRENLERILALARKIHSLYGSRRQHNPALLTGTPNTNTPPEAIPPIALAIPNEITQSLIDGGCPPAAARTLSQAFVQSAHHIRAQYEALYREGCQKWILHRSSDPNSPSVSGLAPVVQKQYRRQLLAAEKLAADRARAFSEPQCHVENQSSRSKPAFNQEFVPLLEKYFEYNPYPPATDRVALARKSMMTSRQIEVWFQNHRNRSKKEGKVLRKNCLDLPPQHISLEFLETSMPCFVIPEPERNNPFRRKNVSQADDDAKEEQVASDETPTLPTFSSSAPSHAFPTTYPPCCNYDPFPVKRGGFVFPTPTWPRKPASSRPVSPPFNFEQFIKDFTSKLSLREPASRKSSVRRGHLPSPWFASTCTIAPPAPHPAFIRPSLITPPSPSPSVHSIPTPPSHLHQYRSPSPSIFIPPQQTCPQVRTKVARLPIRRPKNHSVSHCPAVSVASPPSRSSSFGSDTSACRRLVSSSGSSSSSSSTVTTPEQSNVALPPDVHSPVSVLIGLDLEQVINRFDHFESMSPIEGTPFLIPVTTQTKPPDSLSLTHHTVR